MKKALLAWEFGGGRGHVVHLAAVAAALQGRDYRCKAFLHHLDHASELSGVCEQIAQGPQLPFRTAFRDSPSSRFSDWLWLLNFDDAALLRRTIEAWRALIAKAAPDILVADLAPCAMLAARSLGIPVVQVGVPLSTPPPDLPSYPPFLQDQAVPLCEETMLCETVNRAIEPFGLPALAALPAVLASDDQIVASLSLLDRYGAWRQRPRVAPIIGEWREPGERRREELFIYLSAFDRPDPVILTAIASLRLPTRWFIAGEAPAAAAVAIRYGGIVEPKSRPASEIARTARVLVHSGNHGMCCLGLRAAIPQVTLSDLVEHRFDGRSLAAAGTGIAIEREHWTVPNIRAGIEQAWASETMIRQAETLAEKLAEEFAGDPGEMTAERIEAVSR